MARRRVVITGIGLVTPLGSDRETSWRRLRAGESGLRWLPDQADQHAAALWPDRSAGGPAEVDPNLPQTLTDLGRPDLVPLLREPVISLAVSATSEALSDAGLDFRKALGDRAATVIGTSKGGMHSAFREVSRRHNGKSFASDDDSALWWPMLCPDGPARTVASLFGTTAASLAPVAACATGLVSLIRAAELIQSGCCDVVLAGSSDASLTPAMVASFRRLGVLARGFDDPAAAVRPCDENRNGFLIGEGAAVFVLESAEHAAKRNASHYAEWRAGSLASDAAGLTQLADDSDALRWLIRDTLKRGNIGPSELDLISLHGTATRTNDICEVTALDAELPVTSSSSDSKTAAGGSLLRHGVPAFSAKGSIGHLLGAAGSVEFALMLLALRDQVVPATANLTSPMSSRTLNLVAGRPLASDIQYAMKLSLGFGGHLAGAVVKKGNRSRAM
ncbi:MAG: beta-ketoacyl-[acyl-carrier-protein] synthase family protein [Planctomycetota bacterium]|jgi:3-oxoacyl-[acyl-carrier-protein] synthase II